MAVIYLTVPGNTCVYELPAQVGDLVTIGRDVSCRLCLPDVEGLSAQHCRIDCTAEGYVISDMGSTNGTFAGERRVESEYMSAGVLYTLGEATLAIAGEPAEGDQVLPLPDGTGAAASAAEETATAAPEGAMQGEAASGDAPAAPAAAPRAKKARPARRGSALNMEELRAAAEMFNRNRNKPSQLAMIIYVIVVLAAAFYAGMALHHWQKTGNYLPGIIRQP